MSSTSRPAPPESVLDVLEIEERYRRQAGALGARRARRRGVRVPAWARRPDLLLAVAVVALVLAWALVPSVFTAQSAIDGVPADRLQAPSAAHPFGTDHLGRDLFARVVHGSRLTLQATVLAVLIGLVVGSAIGLVAGFVRGLVDDVAMRVVDVLLSIPALLLSMALITALGFGTVEVAVAVGIGTVANFARVMRSEVLKVGAAVYVEAARAGGVRTSAVLLRHVLPNAAGPVLALSALEFGIAVLAVSALSFLGFGAPPPAPEWGSLVSGGRDYLATAWWLTTLPGLVVAAVVLSANRIARALERRTAA